MKKTMTAVFGMGLLLFGTCCAENPAGLKNGLAADSRTHQATTRMERQSDKEKYIGEGRDFLAENAKKEGVVALPSGLQYRIIKEGHGKKPGPNDTVLVLYRGTLIDGTEFGSSAGTPKEFRVDGVIRGWREALQLMKEGSRWQLFIQPDLAFGERGPLADRTVIYDVEVISVKAS